MKKRFLLSAFSFLFVPIINTNQNLNSYQSFVRNQKKQANNIAWSFNERGETELIQTSYYKKLVFTKILFKTLEYNYFPWNLSKIEVIRSSECYTKVSWGTRSYYGTTLPNFLNGKNFTDLAVNNVINNDNIGELTNIEMLNVKDYDSSAVFIAKEFIGFAWHFNSNINCYILEMSFYFYAETWGSLVGGAMWMDIGEGLKIKNQN